MRRNPRRLPNAWLLATALQASLTAIPARAADVASFHHDHILGTSLDLQIVAPSPDIAEAAHQTILAEVERLRTLLSTYDPATDISRLNAAPVGQPIKVAPELLDVLQQYEHWHTQTAGAYNPAIGSVVKVWQEAETHNTLPTETVLAQEVTALQLPPFTLNVAAGTATRLTDRPLNVDSLGKGFIVSKAVAAARAKLPTLRGLLLNIGGDIATAGYAMQDRKVKWSLAVADPAHPEDNAAPLVKLMMTDLSVATSGGYARGYDIDGVHYSHILDPRTGKPVDIQEDGTPRKRAVASATVIAPDCATANALATTLCVLTPEEGLALVKKTPGAECFLALANGSHLRTEGFRKFEVARPDTFEESTAADIDGPRWPTGYSVNLSLNVKPQGERNGERPYVAVWIEDDQHQHVSTLAVWGNDPRWLREMPGYSRFGGNNPRTIAGVTRATRPAGIYKFAWDGKDQKGRQVPQGDYRICVEVDFDHGGRVYHAGTIRCGTEVAEGAISSSDTFDTVPLTYGPRATAAR